jgi:hypothetical protein
MFIVTGKPAIVCVDDIFKFTTILVDFTFGYTSLFGEVKEAKLSPPIDLNRYSIVTGKLLIVC